MFKDRSINNELLEEMLNKINIKGNETILFVNRRKGLEEYYIKNKYPKMNIISLDFSNIKLSIGKEDSNILHISKEDFLNEENILVNDEGEIKMISRRRRRKEKEIKFDLIIGNPPYQEENSGDGSNAKAFYHKFIEKAISLKPEYISMITPSRWMVGGLGLNNFRDKFKADRRIKYIKHYNNSKDIFPTVDITGGVSYFLWDKKHYGDCEFKVDNEDSFMNNLNKFDVIISNEYKKRILKKVISKQSLILDAKMDYWKLKTNQFEKNSYPNGNIDCYCKFKQVNKIDDNELDDKDNILNKYNVIIPEGMGDIFKKGLNNSLKGKMRIVKDSSWTFTFVHLKSFDTKEEAENFIKYMEGKLIIILLSILTTTQHFTGKTYKILEDFQDYNYVYDDEYLYKRYKLTQDEIDYIEKNVKEFI